MLLINLESSCYEIGLLFFNKKVNTFFRLALVAQAIVSAVLFIASFSSLFSYTKFSDMIMNMAALMIVNDFDNFTGEYFIQKLDTKITSGDDFLVFEGYQ